ncbi:hypothetical protein H4R35_002129, partial [Dimargaris xerosporica]
MGVSFDGYVFTVVLCLSRQGTLVFNTGDLISAAQQAQTALLTPSMLSVLDPHTHANLESIATCGEALSFYLAQTWVKCCPVHNGYGPSEATVMSHSARVHLGQVVTIGRPIPHSPCYILDAHHNVVPVGAIGEIYIGGPGISPGYLNRPDLNATKFITNPFGKGTLYATGDLGRWLSNGEVECLGRIDDQVKVRGYRIEQAEVMGALLAQPAVTAGAVQVCDQQLVAFATPADIDTTAVLNALATQLPHYMVPSHIVPVASIPQTANGKVDARALKACFVEYQRQLQVNALASTQTQSRQLDALQQAIGQVLGMDPATINSGLSFIQLGGDSISAIQLSSQLKQRHYTVPIPAILTRMPLRDLAGTMDECQMRAVSTSLLEPARSASIPLTPIQTTFFGWSLHNPHHFNQSFVMELTQPIAHGQLNDALQQLVGHHAILRSQFTQTVDGDWVQRLASPTDMLEESLVDVITCDRTSLHTHLVQVQRKLDLAKGPLMRGALVELQSDDQTPPTALLFLTAHHLVVDLVSWRILLEDLHCLLQKKRLAPVPVSFGAWVCALQDWGKQWTSDDTACEWTLSLPSIDLSSLDHNIEGNCVTASFTLPAPLAALFMQFESYAKCFSVTPTELLLAALAQALHHVSTDHTVTIWHENHGRHPWSSDVDLSRTVGWFTALYPVTVTVDSAWPHTCFVQRIKHALRTLPHHGLVHGIQRLKQVNCSGTSTYQPLGVVFNYLGQTTDQSTLTLHGQAPWTMRPDLAHGLPVCDGHERRSQLLEVLAYQQDGAVQFDLLYCPQAIPSATIAALTNGLQQALHEMLTGYAQHDEALYWTPSDFPLLDLTWGDLDAIGHELAQQGINPTSVEDLYPMLPTQQGLLTTTAKDPSQYTVQTAFTVQGVGDPSQLHKAFQRVVAQHTILRTRFLLHWTRPGVTGLQAVLCSSDIEWQVIDSWATLNAHDEDEYMRQNYARGFTIGGPMLRCVVVPMADNQLRLVLTMHHAITDGWSMGLLKRALLQELRHSSALSATASPSAKFRDYAEHMLQLESTASTQFWQAHLQAVGEATILTLPKAPNPTTTMQSQVIPLLDDLAEFQRLTQQAGFTINAALKTAWALLLHRYTGQSSVVFGHTVSGRNLNVSRIDQLVGCLINTVPFCVQVARSMPLLDLLHQVSQASTAMIPHEHCHLSAIQQWTPRDLDVFNLFNTLLVYENVPATQHATDDGTIAFTDPHELEFTEYDLAAAIEPIHNQLVLHLGWNAHRLDQAYAIRISQYLSHLLLDVGKALAHSSTVTLVDQLLALPEPEQRMLNRFTTNPLVWDESKTVVDLFTACAQRHPHVAAVELGPAIWDYHTLYSKAHQLASWLLHYGMVAQEPVGIVVARTPAVIAMLLGVSMAGGAFVLIDPEYPLDRISFIASDCGIKHLCYTALHAELAQRVSTTMAVAVHEIDVMLATAPETTPSNVGQALPSNLAYILYTSGSTGQPKGVMIEHRGLSNLVQQTPSILPHTRSHFRHMQALAMTFDACIWDVFTTLCHGGTLVLRDDIARTLHRVDSALLTPSLMAVLDPAQYPNLQAIMAVGEKLPSDLAFKWTQQCSIINGYGPTETTIITTISHYQPNAVVTIGCPIRNAEVHILDLHLRPVPIGAVGELYVGGPGVMRGYVSRPDLDKRALVVHPFVPDKRLFKTGDLGRWLANGEIECLGRQDDQVKIRGMRLELQEVEAVLQQCPKVTMTVALAFGNTLYAVVCPAQVEEAMAKMHLSSQLPAYMVPTRIVASDAIPLTVNGKADKRALLQIISQLKQQSAPRSITPPQSPTQAIIREAMAVALAIGSETVDIHDSFFMLGGDSLSAIRLTGLCREKGLSITVDQVFDKATVAALAQVCQDETTTGTHPEPLLSATQPPAPFALLNFTQDALERARKDIAQQLGVTPTAIVDIVPVSSLQTGFIINTLKDPSAYMVQQSHCITGALDVDRYRQCWQRVGQRHSILRTKFVTTDLVSGHTALQVVLATMDMAWSYDDGHDPSDADFERSYFAADRQHGFAFDGSPLIRMTLFKITDTEHWLFLTFHHALLDVWSMNLILDEVLALYHEQPLYPALQYHTYLAHLMRKPAQAAQAFWQTTLNKVKPTPDLQLPSMLPPSPLPSAPSYECYKHSLSCPLADTHAFSQRLGITTNNLLRGLWALLLSRYLNEQHEVTFGVLVSGRNEPLPGIDDMVGLSINTVPLRAALDHQQPLHDWLRGIHRLSGAIMAHEHASLVDVQKWAGVPADTPLFQSLLVYDKYRESALSIDDPQIQCTAHDAVNFTEYPLTVYFDHYGNCLQWLLQYDSTRLDRAYAPLLAEFFDTCLLRAVQSTTGTTVCDAMQPSEHEHMNVMRWSQGSTAVYDSAICLMHDAFVQNLAKRPEAIALESQGHQWTYARVHHEALILAHWLLDHGFQPDRPVAVVCLRSPDYVFAVLAVLLVGGVYVPIDAEGSTERIRSILDDLSHPVVLSQSTLDDLLSALEPNCALVGRCDVIRQHSTQPSPLPPLAPTRPHSLAYIIYTSGTTGKPKGVMMRHESVVNVLHHTASALALGPHTRCLQGLNLAFDVCAVELFATFLAGGTVVLSMTDLLHDLSLVNTCFLTPSLLAVFDPARYPKLSTVASTGEPLTPSVGGKWAKERALFNCYGPTETNISHTTRHQPNDAVHIGQPIPNTQAYILDEHYQPVPTGVPGQVCMAGIGVADGYWNQPDLTAKAFADNPFGPGKLYLTGDVGCWLPNGRVKLFGRLDHQVKLRGFRIELGELETTAQSMAEVNASTAIVYKQRLMLFVAPSSVDCRGLQTVLRSKLPAYMVPHRIVPLSELPVTAVGKVDRRALTKLATSLLTEPNVAHEVPLDSILGQLLACIAEATALPRETLDPTQSFFALGGDSISAIRLMMQCTKRGWAVTVPDVFSAGSIVELAETIESQKSAPSVAQSSLVPFTTTEQWYLDTFQQHPQGLWGSAIVSVSAGLTLEALTQWGHTVLCTHGWLCAQLDTVEGGWCPMPCLSLRALDTVISIQQLTNCSTVDDIHRHVMQTKSALPSERSPLLHLMLFTLDDDVTVLALVAHRLLVELHQWPMIMHSLASAINHSMQSSPSTVAFTPAPLESCTWHPLAIRYVLPAPTVKPLLAFATLHSQPQYLDAVTLGCFAYAYHRMEPMAGMDVLHSTNYSRPSGRSSTAKSLLLMSPTQSAALTYTIEQAKAMLYQQQGSASAKDCALAIDANDGQPRVLYHAITGASARLLDLAATAPLLSPFHDMFGQAVNANRYQWEAMALKATDGLELLVTANSAPEMQSHAIRLLHVWAQALEQFATVAAGTRDGVTACDYPLLSLDCPQLQHLAQTVLTALGLDKWHVADVLPTSSLQDSFILGTLKDPMDSIVQQSYRITMPLDVEWYRECWRQVGQRHSILRTKFVTTDLIPGHTAVQVVLPALDMTWTNEVCDQPMDQEMVNYYLARDRQDGLALDGSALLRATLVKATHTDHYLLLTLHHALLDAWSINVLLDEVMALYHHQPLQPVPQYRDYIAHLAQQPRDATQTFWHDLLHDATATPDLQLPSAWSPAGQTARGQSATHCHTLSSTLSDVQVFCQRLGVTTNSLLRALWALLLSRYLSNCEDIVFGVLVSGRNVPLPGIDDMVGLCINTVPFRAKLDCHQPLHHWLQSVHRLSGRILAHEHAGLVDIQRWAKQPTDIALFQSLLAYNSYRNRKTSWPIEQASAFDTNGLNVAEYPLTAMFHDAGNQLQMVLMYDAGQYDSEYILLLSSYLDSGLTWFLQSTPDALLPDVWQLPESEHRMIAEWSQGVTKTLDPSCRLLPDLFLNTLYRTRDAIALEYGSIQWTYAQVHQRALLIASRLQAHGVAHQSKVALVFTRSPDYIFSLLAVLMLGAIYVPIDATHGIERIGGILSDLHYALVLTQSAHLGIVDGLSSNLSIICVDLESEIAHRGLPSLDTSQCCSTTDLAYIIFTSGTTGKPKGVQVRHESAVNILIHIAQTMALDSNCRFLQLLNIAFDGCLIEMFSTFYAGGTVVLSTSDIPTDLHHANACFLTPSLLSVLNPTDYPNVQRIIGGGEALPWEVASKWHHHCTLYHAYGPTEITVISNIEPFDPALSVCFSQPIPNAQCHILNRQRRPVPVGVPGEICIAGVGVSNGYLNRPDLTAKVFVSNPFGAGQIYRTGDLGCWLPNGKIKYLGRKDFQVKLRGFRIELGEVESTAQALDTVNMCAAIVKDKQLVLYVTPMSVDQTRLREVLASKLPPYMVPEHIIAIEQLPLTRIGKVDRRALQALPLPELPMDSTADPSHYSPIFVVLRDSLAEVLAIELDRIQPTSSFFRLGGDSISAIQLVAKCKRHGMAMTVAQVLKYPILAQLEQHVNMVSGVSVPKLTVADDPVGPLPLTAIQRWFMYDTGHGNMDHFNQSFVLKCREPLTVAQLCGALLMLINHHDALRTRFIRHHETKEWQAQVLPVTNALDTHAHLEAATVSQGELDSKVLHLQTRLSVDCALNVAGGLLTVDGTQVLFLAVHHLVVDLVSWRILLEDLEALLTGQSLPPKTLSFRQWAHQANDYAQTLPNDQWPDYGPVDPFLLDNVVSADHVPTYASCQTVISSIGVQATAQLFGDAAAVAHAQPQDFMLAALAMALQSVLGAASFEVDLESHGRYPWSDQQDISRTVGWFTSLYPVPLHLPSADSTSADYGFDVLRHVKHRIHAMPNHGFPYGLRKYCRASNTATDAHSPSYQPTRPRQHVVFNYVGRFDQLEQANAFWQEHSLPLPWPHYFSLQEPFSQAFLVTCSLEPSQGLTMSLMYSTDLHASATSQCIADQWCASLQSLVAHTMQHAQPCWAPCDFELLSLTEPQLDQLIHQDLTTLCITPAEVEAIYPCLPLQEGIVAALVHDPTAYSVQTVMAVHGALDTAKFQQAWNSVVDRHPILRTRFLVQPHCQAAAMLQVVTKALVPEWTIDTELAEQAYLAADLARGFDAAGALLRFALFSVSAQEHHFVLTMHHALTDGWSLSLLLADVLAHYTNKTVLPVPGRYQDVVQYSMAQDPSTALAFWRAELEAITAPCHLPSPHSTAPGMATKRFTPDHFATASLTLDNLAAISQFAQQHNITLSTLLRAVVTILLQYYTGNDHVLFGVTLSGRNLPVGQIEHVVGPCINTVPCHAHLTTDTTVWALLDQLQQSSVQTMPYEHCSLTDIHRCTAVDPGQALFNTLLVYENYPQATPDASCLIAFEYEHVEQNTEYPLTILAGADADQLDMLFMYRTDIFPQEYIEQVIAHCERIVTSIVASTSDTLVSQVDPLSAAERQLLLTTFATNPQPYPVGYAHQHFMDQVSQRPDAIAVRTTANEYTYRQLSAMAHALAAQLAQIAPAAPDSIVAIVADNSVELIVGQLAVWLTGCAFAIIDPRYPLERKRFILSDAQCVAVLGHTTDLCDIPTTQPAITLDTLDASAAQPVAFAPITPVPSDLAWLIYTSGSTGQPKGVMTEHRAAANHFCGARTSLSIDEHTVTPTVLTPTFDVSVSQIWTTLSFGGTVLVTDRDFAHVFSQVDRVCCTPSLLSTLEPAKYRNLTHITLTGEPVPQALVDQWALHAKVVNWYGPTEVAIGTHYAELSAGDKPVIGKPYPNAIGYILDASMRPVPIGVVGELYLGGEGVARGYLNQPELTAEKFIANPFGPGRLFKSGDLARWLPGGNVECLGRRDDQVKVRGYRIELDEMANTLAQFKGVHQACVVVQDSQLIGYVSPEDVDTKAIIAFVKSQLPHYMVPAAIVPLTALPLTPVGKIDRNALPKHTFAPQFTDASTIPRTAIEDRLICMVAQVLNIPQETISPQDTFFQLGGDSLSAIRLSALCRDQGLKLTVPRLFERPALSDIAEYALEAVGMVQEVAEKVPPFALLNQPDDGLEHTLDMIAHQLNLSRTAIEDVLPTSSLQEGFVINTLRDPSAYMVQQAFELTGDLDVERYQNAWQAVCQHHAILRTKFAVTDRVVPYSSLQVVTTHADLAWHYDSCPTIDCNGIAAFKQAWLVKDRAQGFHLNGSPLVRLALAKAEPSLHLLFLSFHHALLDAWSVSLVLDQVLEMYHGQSLPPTLPYSAFIHHTSAQGPEACQVFWKTTLEDVKPTPAIQLPSTTPVCDSMKTHATYSHAISTPSAAIQQFCQQQSITLNTLIRAIWAMVLARYLDERDEVTFGTLVSGRNVPLAGIDQMVGLTINTVPFRAKLDLDAPIHTWLSTIHTQSTAIMAYEHASLVDIMRWAHATPGQPLFATLLVHTPTHEPPQPQYEQTIHQVESGGYNATEYPLVVSFGQDGERVVASLQYACAKYDSAYMSYLASYIDHCISGMVNSMDTTPLASLFSLPPTESQQIEQWAHGEDRVLDPTVQFLEELFTRNLDQRPDATALESGDQHWTYAEVYQHAVAIASCLQEHGVTHQAKVALVFTRSPHFVFSLLAVLMLGAVYTPIDAAHGAERVCSILDDLGHPLVVTESSQVSILNGHVSNNLILCVDGLRHGPNLMMRLSPYSCSRSPKDLAYIIFTSGTTGKPKGVQVRHESIVNSVSSMSHLIRFTKPTRMAQLLNISFDGCIAEVFTAFDLGATLVLFSTDIMDSFRRIDSCYITPSLLSALDPADCPNLSTAITCGEPLTNALASTWYNRCALFNFYGPSECAVGTHGARVTGSENLTIGTPFPNLQSYILDESQQKPVPIGVPGEICIAGIGVSNGYLNRPDLTAKAFVSNPFGAGQIYRTGDLGCWLPNGKIKYLDRKDFQVKLRGFRIELSEVEHAVMKHPSVSTACAIVQDGNLVAFITPSACDPQSITQLISQSLPPYMVPQRIVSLDQLPLTAVGKVDRRALAQQAASACTETTVAHSVPLNSTLGQLMTCVAQVLSIPYNAIDPTQSFFSVGGDSISAIQLMMQCTKRGWAAAVPDIFHATSVAELAQVIEAQQPVSSVNVMSLIPLTRTEQWYLNTYQQCPQGQWASAIARLPNGTALDAVKHWIVGFAHEHSLINRQLNQAQ